MESEMEDKINEHLIKQDDMKKEWKTLTTIPASDGYHMPGEFEWHEGCIMIWPERPGSWIYGAARARAAFCNVIAVIAESEKVFVAAGKRGVKSACMMLLDDQITVDNVTGSILWSGMGDKLDWRRNVEIFLAETDDAWARDIAPTFVVKNISAVRGQGQSGEERSVRAVNWEFNAWGGSEDGLYTSWDKDNAFAMYFAQRYAYACYDAAPFVLEGGSIHSDGEGTVMVTESCLLSKGRNPKLSKDEITEQLKKYLGARKVLWLPRGIYMDETNEHVDNVCAFLRPGEVVLAWTEHEEDPQYALSRRCLDYLEQVTDAKGRKLVIHKLPIPDIPVCITEEELAGYTFWEGEDERKAGERLAASYVNFYFSNEAVVMPIFGGDNKESDERAVKAMERWNPERKVIPVAARDILLGGGNIHCITQQIPAAGRGKDCC